MNRVTSARAHNNSSNSEKMHPEITIVLGSSVHHVTNHTITHPRITGVMRRANEEKRESSRMRQARGKAGGSHVSMGPRPRPHPSPRPRGSRDTRGRDPPPGDTLTDWQMILSGLSRGARRPIAFLPRGYNNKTRDPRSTAARACLLSWDPLNPGKTQASARSRPE